MPQYVIHSCTIIVFSETFIIACYMFACCDHQYICLCATNDTYLKGGQADAQSSTKLMIYYCCNYGEPEIICKSYKCNDSLLLQVAKWG